MTIQTHYRFKHIQKYTTMYKYIKLIPMYNRVDLITFN